VPQTVVPCSIMLSNVPAHSVQSFQPRFTIWPVLVARKLRPWDRPGTRPLLASAPGDVRCESAKRPVSWQFTHATFGSRPRCPMGPRR
jgi:hypothetical protein